MSPTASTFASRTAVPLTSLRCNGVSHAEQMPEWNETGYDLLKQDRYVYAFLSGPGTEVKVGMVGVSERLAPRLREVAKKWNDPALQMVGSSVVPNVDSQTVESIEAVIRHWLVFAAGFEHSGRVDGLRVPTPPPGDWSELLAEAVAFALDSAIWVRRPRLGVQ
jgi:hypothetical protein